MLDSLEHLFAGVIYVRTLELHYNCPTLTTYKVVGPDTRGNQATIYPTSSILSLLRVQKDCFTFLLFNLYTPMSQRFNTCAQI